MACSVPWIPHSTELAVYAAQVPSFHELPDDLLRLAGKEHEHSPRTYTEGASISGAAPCAAVPRPAARPCPHLLFQFRAVFCRSSCATTCATLSIFPRDCCATRRFRCSTYPPTRPRLRALLVPPRPRPRTLADTPSAPSVPTNTWPVPVAGLNLLPRRRKRRGACRRPVNARRVYLCHAHIVPAAFCRHPNLRVRQAVLPA